MRIVEGLDRPSDLVVLPDGRVMIAERAGRVRVVQDDGLVDRPALSVESDDPRIGAVLAVAIDPQFPRTHFVYAIYTSRSRQGSTVFTVARFREVSNTLADRVVLLDGIRASADPHAALRVGPDAKLYAAFDDGGEERLAADPASFNGKILRLNLDGTTPADQPRGSPILSVGPRSPRGLDWHRQSGHLWSAGERHVGSLRSTTPLAAIAASEDALFVASAAGLMRARVDPHNLERFAGIDEVLHGVVIRAMATKADGTIVFATDTAVGTVAPPNGR